jgi:hypothetical protein
MKKLATIFILATWLTGTICNTAGAYSSEMTVPESGSCSQPNLLSFSSTSPLNRRWSTTLPTKQTIITVAANGTSAQTDEIEQLIADSFGAWTGVTGTTMNSTAHPGAIAALERTSGANACTNDTESNVDGLNTICFDQSSAAFTSGVLAFTRVITANAPGISVGSGPPATFAGQILDADTMVRSDGQEIFVTPGALLTPAGQGAFDLESILTHELGHWMGLGHSGVIRAMMFPFAPPPGQFLGSRPTPQAPDGMLADDDRTGLRTLYPDASDTVDIGTIRGKIVPANPFSLVTIPAPAPGQAVTGIFGGHVVAVDADTGDIVAGVLGGWSCNASQTVQFDGTFEIDRLPIGHNYVIYAEPFVGLAAPGSFMETLGNLCAANGVAACNPPPVDLNFNVSMLPASH